jgi:hypothetical protein
MQKLLTYSHSPRRRKKQQQTLRSRVFGGNASGKLTKEAKKISLCLLVHGWRHWLTSGSDDVSAIALAKVETWTVRGIIAKQFDKFGSF